MTWDLGLQGLGVLALVAVTFVLFAELVSARGTTPRIGVVCAHRAARGSQATPFGAARRSNKTDDVVVEPRLVDAADPKLPRAPAPFR